MPPATKKKRPARGRPGTASGGPKRPKSRPKPNSRPKPKSRAQQKARPKSQPGANVSRKPASRRGRGPVTKWSQLEPRHDVWGKEFARHYKLETLASAVDGAIESGHDSFIVPSIKKQLGPSALVSLKFELVQEGTYQFIFRVRAANSQKKRGSFGFVVAKNELECTRTLTREHMHLQWLEQRIPNAVVESFKGGYLFLPDRHRRHEKNRKIYGYTTRWLTGFHEMGMRKDLGFYMNSKPQGSFTRGESDAIKRRIIEIILRSYDSRERTSMDLPQVATGDFVVSKPSSGTPKLRLVSCQRLSTRATTERIIHRILTTEWNWGKQTYSLAPSDPAEFVQAMHNALGKAEAKTWYERYRAAVTRNRLKGDPAISIDKLDPHFGH